MIEHIYFHQILTFQIKYIIIFSQYNVRKVAFIGNFLFIQMTSNYLFALHIKKKINGKQVFLKSQYLVNYWSNFQENIFTEMEKLALSITTFLKMCLKAISKTFICKFNWYLNEIYIAFYKRLKLLTMKQLISFFTLL